MNHQSHHNTTTTTGDTSSSSPSMSDGITQLIGDNTAAADHNDIVIDNNEIQQSISIEKSLNDTVTDGGVDADADSSEVIEDNSITGFYQHRDSVYCVTTYGDYVATGDGFDNHCQACVWSVVDGTLVCELPGRHSDTIIDVKFNHNGTLLATASMDSTIHIYNVSENFKHLHTLTGPSAEIEFLVFHRYGNVLAVGGADSTVWMYHAENAQTMHIFTGHLGSVLCGTWSTDGKLLVTGSDDGTIYVWNPKSGQAKYPKVTHSTSITSMAAHPYESVVACGAADGVIKAINLDNGHIVSTYSNAQSIEAGGIEGLAYSNNRDMKLLASGHVDGSIYVWDTSNRTIRAQMKHELLMKRDNKRGGSEDTKMDEDDGSTNGDESEVSVTHLEFHRSEPYIFSSSLDGTVRMWEARTGQQLALYSGHHQAVLSFAINYKHNRIVTASDDHKSLVFPINQPAQ